MIEVEGNIWEYRANAVCITTNCSIKSNKRAVMGAGVALQAREMFPDIDAVLGNIILSLGHGDSCGVYTIWARRYEELLQSIFCFPTKYHWKDKSILGMIERSAKCLVEIWENRVHPYIIALPRPGCGCGGLDWEKEVKPLLSDILISDDFVIVHKERE